MPDPTPRKPSDEPPSFRPVRSVKGLKKFGRRVERIITVAPRTAEKAEKKLSSALKRVRRKVGL